MHRPLIEFCCEERARPTLGDHGVISCRSWPEWLLISLGAGPSGAGSVAVAVCWGRRAAGWW